MKTKNKEEIRARKRARKQEQKQQAENTLVITPKTAEVTMTARGKQKLVMFGYATHVNHGISSCGTFGTERDANKHHFGFGVDPMGLTKQEVAKSLAEMFQMNELPQLHFDKGSKIKDYLRTAVLHKDLIKLHALLEWCVTMNKLGKVVSAIQAPLLEALNFATVQLFERKITWWGIQHFFNNHFNLDLIIPENVYESVTYKRA